MPPLDLALLNARVRTLDDERPRAPALLISDDLHTAVATPRALELAGVTGPRRFEEQSEVVCDADGTPTGELREWGAMALVREAMPVLTDDDRHALHAAQLRRFA